MDQKFFRVPFAQSGDRQTIPDTTPTSGAVSFPSGWGGDYASDPTVDANAKPVEREAMNAILFAITNAVRQYQTFGFPEYITPADNNGAAFAYSSSAVIRYRAAADQPFKSYVSIADNNTSVPGADAKWQEFIYRESTEQEAIDGKDSHTIITPRRLHDGASYLDEQMKISLLPQLIEIGMGSLWFGDTAPDGWLEANGQAFDVEKYPKLALKFPSGRVPDARGRFLRGWAHGSTVDPDSNRENGSTQEDSVQNMTGEFQTLDLGSSTPSGVFKHGFRDGAQVSGSFVGAYHSIVEFDSSRVVRTSDETRAKNIAVMIVIKTDLAESTPGTSTPNAIVVTPQSAIVNAGTTRQFSAAVLPAEFQNDYPVSWSVSDSALGSISSTGLYTATAGQTGTQTIIASISTGLTQTVTLNQYIFLTAISIAAIPNMEVEDTYNLAVTFTPTNYTEPVDYASSDAQIASVINGTVTGVGAGTATASVTGRYSGVTASRPVTVTPKIVVEKYLQINGRLSEIAAAGATAQAEARSNLGLAGLATKDGLTAAEVGAVPQANASIGIDNLNTVISPGRKFQSLTSNATLARNYPVALAGMLDVIRTTDAGIRQSYYPYNSTDVYHRYCVDTAANPIVFSSWAKSGGDYLEKSQNLADVPNKSTARDNLGVGYTVSTSVAPTDATGYAAGHMWYREES
ncbi:Ig-like domain-containing protein [Pectobacterium polaris]|uniref:Ig-like domain-containing protein n=1 Tax=Pectobacterium polaris TaxID=2042057 RepID=UPI00202D4B9F|nr:Ig-like domain-containing protein [Pectobacterium polaris]MCL6323978.1 phage tail protein [Pectobacterium polaris]